MNIKEYDAYKQQHISKKNELSINNSQETQI
jgi:hypothetical protein